MLDAAGLDSAAYDAVVLAGGRAHRLGGVDKPAVLIKGTSLLGRAVDAVALAGRLVIVGARRDVETPRSDVVWCVEDPPDGGPVAGLAAALPHTTADTVLVLAADLPWIGGGIAALVAAVPADGAALLVDAGGRLNYLAAAWRRASLARALAGLDDVHGASMRALLRAITHVPVPDPDGWGTDCDTWADVDAARRSARLRP